MKNQFRLLKSRRFLPLFLTQYLGAYNDNIFKSALIILITYMAADALDMNAGLLVTVAAGIFILPFFLFSALAGQIAEKYPKDFLIRRLKAIEILLMILVAVGFYYGEIYFLLFMLFLMGTQSSFFGPIKYSILPELVEREELIGANAWVEAATFIAILLGTIVGAYFVIKDGGIMTISISILLVSALGFISSLFIPRLKPAKADININLNFLKQSWHLLRTVKPQKDIFKAILGISWFWSVGFVVLTYVPVYGSDVLSVNEDVVTVFLVSFSVGIAIGSLLCNRLLRGQIKMSLAPYGALGMGVFILLLCLLSPSYVQMDAYRGLAEFAAEGDLLMLLGLMVMIAICAGIYVVPLYTILQARTDKGKRAPTIAANNIMNALFMVVVSLACLGLLSVFATVLELFLVVGLLNFMVAFLFLGKKDAG